MDLPAGGHVREPQHLGDRRLSDFWRTGQHQEPTPRKHRALGHKRGLTRTPVPAPAHDPHRTTTWPPPRGDRLAKSRIPSTEGITARSSGLASKDALKCVILRMTGRSHCSGSAPSAFSASSRARFVITTTRAPTTGPNSSSCPSAELGRQHPTPCLVTPSPRPDDDDRHRALNRDLAHDQPCALRQLGDPPPIRPPDPLRLTRACRANHQLAQTLELQPALSSRTGRARDPPKKSSHRTYSAIPCTPPRVAALCRGGLRVEFVWNSFASGVMTFPLRFGALCFASVILIGKQAHAGADAGQGGFASAGERSCRHHVCRGGTELDSTSSRFWWAAQDGGWLDTRVSCKPTALS